MKYSIILLLSIMVFFSCKKEDDATNDVCQYKTELNSPPGHGIKEIGKIDFNGSVKSFQFLDPLVGYALMTKNVGGYLEVFKTIDGGKSWKNLELGMSRYPGNMIFKDKNLGIVTLNNGVLRTQDGGSSWEEINTLKGTLYHPTFDKKGNLYGNLYEYNSINSRITLMKSVDNGKSWETFFNSPELGITLVTFSYKLYEDKLFVSGREGKILKIDTEGRLLKIIDLKNPNIWDFEVIDENNLIAVVSGIVIKSRNGGDTWETIHEGGGRILGFDSIDKGLMFLIKSVCETDVYQVNETIASTKDGGKNWQESKETTTNLSLGFSNSQKMGAGVWYFMLGNKLYEIKEN
jgi:photosystem II stability/assembly factor-like uncharacterized protein